MKLYRIAGHLDDKVQKVQPAEPRNVKIIQIRLHSHSSCSKLAPEAVEQGRDAMNTGALSLSLKMMAS